MSSDGSKTQRHGEGFDFPLWKWRLAFQRSQHGTVVAESTHGSKFCPPAAPSTSPNSPVQLTVTSLPLRPAGFFFVCPIAVQSAQSGLAKLPVSGWDMIMHAVLCFIVQICVCDVAGTDK